MITPAFNWSKIFSLTDEWGLGIVACLAAVGILYGIRRILLYETEKRFSSHPSLARAILHELVLRTRYLAALVVGSAALFQMVTFSPKAEITISRVITLLFFIQVGSWGSGAIRVWVNRILEDRVSKDPAQATSFFLVTFAIRSTFFVILTLVTLNNLGINVSALIAGLGVGGVAVALAVQNILGDLFASLTIVLDKPFAVGDALGVDTFAGTVEHIGLKTTRIRSATGEQLIFGNADLLRSRVKNYKRQSERPVTLQVGISYQTDRALIDQIPQIFKNVIAPLREVRFDRAHLIRFGPSSLDFEIVYTILTADYLVFLNSQQQILLAVYDEFRKLKIEIPYPTQTVFLEASRLPSPSQEVSLGSRAQ